MLEQAQLQAAFLEDGFDQVVADVFDHPTIGARSVVMVPVFIGVDMAVSGAVVMGVIVVGRFTFCVDMTGFAVGGGRRLGVGAEGKNEQAGGEQKSFFHDQNGGAAMRRSGGSDH